MHGYQTESGVSFNYNGDYSGDVIIRAPNWDDEKEMLQVKVSFEDLKDLVASSIRMKRISEIEQMTTEQLLGLE